MRNGSRLTAHGSLGPLCALALCVAEVVTSRALAVCPTANGTTFNDNKPDRWLDVPPSSFICAFFPFSSRCGDSLVYLPGDSDGNADPGNDYLKDPLFVFLPGTGEEPEDYKQVLRMAAFAGYRTIGLSYHNMNDLEDQCLVIEAHPVFTFSRPSPFGCTHALVRSGARPTSSKSACTRCDGSA